MLGGFQGQPGATAPLWSLMWIAGIIEFAGGLLIALGLLTRPIAFLAAGAMAAAYFIAYAPRAFWPIQNQGELAALNGFLFFYLFFRGAGRFSLDRLLADRRGGVVPSAGVSGP